MVDNLSPSFKTKVKLPPLENTPKHTQTLGKGFKNFNKIYPDLIPIDSALRLQSNHQSMNIDTNRENQETHQQRPSIHKPEAKLQTSEEGVSNLIDALGLNTSGFEDGLQSKLAFHRLQTFDMSTGLVAMVGTFITVLTYDLEFEQRDIELLKTLLWMSFASTIVALLLNVLTHLQRIEYLKSRRILENDATIFSSGAYKLLIIEFFMILIQPYPFLQGIRVDCHEVLDDQDYYYYVNDFLSLFMVVRVYIILRFVINATLYRSPRARRLTNIYGSSNTYLYAIRCLMKTSSIPLVGMALCSGLIVFGYMLRICERPLYRDTNFGMSFQTYYNSIWNVILNITTVGYGDTYPKTFLGRFVSFILCLWGASMVSLVLLVLQNILRMDSKEEQVLTLLHRLGLRRKLREEAIAVISGLARLKVESKKAVSQEKAKENKRKGIVELKKHLTNFKSLNRTIKENDGSGNTLELMNGHFEIFRNEVCDIRKKQRDLLDTLSLAKKLIEKL